jgi:membrane-associated phospholipid phosphatase
MSRGYLGVHYPSDVIAGSAAALTWVMVVMFLFENRQGKVLDYKVDRHLIDRRLGALSCRITCCRCPRRYRHGETTEPPVSRILMTAQATYPAC